ncbi:rhodanese-like domain-containing protein [Paenibacillus sinopodophylli]|uniref:rhodanese-like domain-containing protein n=1 Tax=Paenibacillus sinopodophylli TaxID=1837342 RepID=UPI00110D0CD3|nr:rhodanese-like domain-containing protein [Paenibacillus sinopodophylli]
MFWLMCTFVFLVMFVSIRQLWPLSNIKYINEQDFKRLQVKFRVYKVVDLRDASEFYSNPRSGTINISLGRLPYVWKKHLDPEEHVFILSQGLFKTKKAARILRKQGFSCLYVVEMIK